MTSQTGSTDRSPGTAGFSWQSRQDAVLTVCEACRPDDAARWLRQFRTAVLRALRADAIAITLAGCTRLCPGDGRVALVLSLPGGRILATGVMPTAEAADRLLAELGLLLGAEAWLGRRVLAGEPADSDRQPRRAALSPSA